MRQVPVNPGPPPDANGRINWLIDRVTQLCTASQVDTPTDVASRMSSSYQPLDADLTAIAALATTSFGRSLLTQANAAAVRTLLSLVVGTNVQAWDVLLDSMAALSDPNADRAAFWDDSAGAMAWLRATNGLEITGTDLQMTSAQRSSAIVWTIDGGGAAITTGNKGDILIPFACTISRATLLADQVGSAVVDIYKAALGSYPPSGSICASAKPTLSAAASASDATLTGWTTSIAANDTLRFNVDSAATVTRVSLILTVTKT